MDAKRAALSYSSLFNLESLTNFQLPQQVDEFDYYGNSSQDESRASQGGATDDFSAGIMLDRESTMPKKRRYFQVDHTNTDDEECNNHRAHISEDWYRKILGEHVVKYQRRSKDTTPSPASTTRFSIQTLTNNVGSRTRKVDTVSEWLNGTGQQKSTSFNVPDFAPDYGSTRMLYESGQLEVDDGIIYKIPPTYEKLAVSLNLPTFSEIQVEDCYLKGTLDLGSLAAMLAAKRFFGLKDREGTEEPHIQYHSLQDKLKALASSTSSPKFNLKVTETGLHSLIPEGAAGNIPRSILSEGGVLHVYYVKVLEKGDTYEIIERSLPRKQTVNKDPSMVEREELDKIAKVWVSLVRKDLPKHHRVFTSFHRKQMAEAKRFSEGCQREVKQKAGRSLKQMKAAAIRTRKLARDMLLYWKRVDKEMAEIRKKEEKEAAEALRREQEMREARRQQQRLNFLIQQTELYSHFMQNKSTAQFSGSFPTDNDKSDHQGAFLSLSEVVPAEEESSEDADLRKEALRAAQDAVFKQKEFTNAFDSECAKLRHTAETQVPSFDNSVAGSSDMDLLHPSTMPVTSSVQTPELFKGVLKEYQLKGLQWLVNCYEQGLNGILADEMGLGKTIQAMAFLAHLAEEKNIWGPFLVVAPASVLNNWADEIGRFCPELKTLPYWGPLQERTVLRKNMNPKRLYRRDAGFHILITSYQLLVADEKYFRRVKWQYMVLDEAQAIKSANSIRWKTLLSFNCRNRLLLTGTPIQNNMAELWALLHFIMPTLFDSHEQFDEWFSKGIENHAEHGDMLNEHQLNRLHAILKPFMLRRVKKDVVSELTRKTEVTVHCKLSSRQQAFYQAIKNKISVAELFDRNRGHLTEKKLLNLMNIVIQLRKVCNHPELFERNEGSTYFYFGDIPNSLLPPPFGELEDVHYSGSRNPIAVKIPKLLLEEFQSCRGISTEMFLKQFNIFSALNVSQSIYSREDCSNKSPCNSGAFGFTRLMDLSPAEVAYLATCSLTEKILFSVSKFYRQYLDSVSDLLTECVNINTGCSNEMRKVRAVTRMLLVPSRSEMTCLMRKLATGPREAPFEALVSSHEDRIRCNAKVLRSVYSFIPRARATPVDVQCSDRNFSYKAVEELHNPWVKRVLLGFARTSDCNGPWMPNGPPHHLIQEIDSELPVSQPVLQLTYKIFGSCPPMRSFDPAKLLTDSGKLQTLDILLKRLRAGNHRVLLFAQMTKMLDILEDYMNYRRYKYLRLDGSSSIMDRRDMVRDFQNRSDIFVFLLSTRAGGLGINLTAADTVIFYESDWNPTLDLQAMDRAHRLGQKKDVTVYRLICKETVEEKILQRASQKNTVQQLVMTGGHVQGDFIAPEDVVSLLLEDSQLEQRLKEAPLLTKDRQKKKGLTKGIRLDAEGNDASLEELANIESDHFEPSLDPEQIKSGTRKRKPNTAKSSQKLVTDEDGLEASEIIPGDLQNIDAERPKPKRTKRPKKSVNENPQSAFDALQPDMENQLMQAPLDLNDTS
uniref:Chromatin-remodeling ATPase INO80 n=1 Tax=Kalanchoe fedtschenkoi TaxID=63787 RepID=A0A7N0TWC5_KALFE